MFETELYGPPLVDWLEISVLLFCFGLRGGVLWGRGGGGGFGGCLVLKRAVLGRREAELFWHFILWLSPLVESQFPQQSIDF